MKTIYVVTYNEKMSSKAYSKFENAVKFIESRSDSPERLGNALVWISKTGNYKIHPVTINDLD